MVLSFLSFFYNPAGNKNSNDRVLIFGDFFFFCFSFFFELEHHERENKGF